MGAPARHIKWMPVLMTLTILAITGFQLYWLKQAYEREERTLEIRMNMTFRETVQNLQASKIKWDMIPDSLGGMEQRMGPAVRMRMRSGEKVTRMTNVLMERVIDTTIAVRRPGKGKPGQDSARVGGGKHRKQIMEFLYDMESFQDSVKVKEIDSVYTMRLGQLGIDVPFAIARLDRPTEREERVYNEVTLGFRNPTTYRLSTGDTVIYLLQRISAPILLSIFLVAFTIVSFSLLYRNLLRQQRLGDIKNEFISNITHELKTPIATVSVAIEALRNFSAGMDADKTKEYLDISANELQRLSLLVDKVLKLTMFEKQEVELKYEPLDMTALVAEVTASMKLQAEKHQAVIDVTSEGNTFFEGDRLHLVSVIFNLVDNALKYSNSVPEIRIHINGTTDKMILTVADNGIGVPDEYKDKIFEKFFRVPTGNLHNAKGYGLGLSYVAHVVHKHKGEISVDCEGGGSKFIIALPKEEKA
jgi:two-component system phosphate regulon sensor histidine kinase PhoR